MSGSSNLPDFLVLINSTVSDWRSTASGGNVDQTDGGDIVFTRSDGITKLDHEIESYTAASGALVAWVEIPTLDYDDDTVFYIYYGNDAGGLDEQNITGTWSAAFQGVWHLYEDPSTTGDGDCAGGTKEVCDSTSNNNDGDSNGSMTSSDQVAGQNNGSLDFDQSDDYIDTNYAPNWGAANDFSVSLWYKSDDTTHTADQNLFGSYNDTGTNDDQVIMEVDGDGSICADEKILFTARDTDSGSSDYVCSTTSVNDTSWHHVIGTFDVNGNMVFYFDGTQEDSTAVTSNTNGEKNLADGIFIAVLNNDGSPSTDYFDGKIDEARIRNDVINTDIILTEYNNQNSPSSFYTIAGEESANKMQGFVLRGGVIH